MLSRRPRRPQIHIELHENGWQCDKNLLDLQKVAEDIAEGDMVFKCVEVDIAPERHNADVGMIRLLLSMLKKCYEGEPNHGYLAHVTVGYGQVEPGNAHRLDSLWWAKHSVDATIRAVIVRMSHALCGLFGNVIPNLAPGWGPARPRSPID